VPSCDKDIFGFKANEISPAKAVAKIEEKINLIIEGVQA
jgi:hypothetical protein